MIVYSAAVIEHGVATDTVGALRVGPGLLVAGRRSGALAGTTVVVKDLFDLAGERTGAGNPTWLAEAPVAEHHAAAVTRLVEAGASVVGKSHTDELAFSLSGTNVHYGTPANVNAPGRIPGGSSSGSAAAVAAGLADLGLGTDTGGSIRVPASYCGVLGWRPTHGRVPVDGLVPLSPWFDTVGLFARDGGLFEAGGLALLNSSPGEPARRFVLAADLADEADAAVATAVAEAARGLAGRLGGELGTTRLAGGQLGEWLAAFRGRQLVEAWQTHGVWVGAHPGALGPGIAARFAAAAATPAAAAPAAEPVRRAVRAALDAALGGDATLVLPSAATVAPTVDLHGDAKDDLRLRTLRLTCVAGLAGAPAVSLPLADVDGVPVGVCLVGRPGDDERLLATARALDQSVSG
jgi:amidase